MDKGKRNKRKFGERHTGRRQDGHSNSSVVMSTKDGQAHRTNMLRLEQGDKFLNEHEVKEIFPFVADDFDDPLPEDFLVRALR